MRVLLIMMAQGKSRIARTKMWQKLITLLFVFYYISNPQASEPLNLELDCQLSIQRYFGNKYLGVIEAEERFSIKNSKLFGSFALGVTDTEIFWSRERKDLPNDGQLHLQNFHLDRLTGKLKLTAYGPKANYTDVQHMEEVTGICIKLDPNVRKF